MKVIPPATLADPVRIELTQVEAIGLYKLALSADDPRGPWPGDEDVQTITAALQVQLSAIVGQ